MAKKRAARKGKTPAEPQAKADPLAGQPGWQPVPGVTLRMTLRGHKGYIGRIAWSPDGKRLASPSADNKICIWDAVTGEIVRTLKGNADVVYSVAWSPDGRRLASEERTETRQISGKTSISFSSSGKIDSILHATAKIVLVGDSGVGKTGLGWRLAHGEFKHHASTHGQQFWVLDQLHGDRKDGTRCEAVLWDLAGQPDYRLIHALHVTDADLALILFDPTNSRDPLGSVHYWLGQLPLACPKILVPARIDRGSPTLTHEELDQFCQQRQITGGFVETSAFSGVGLDDLLARMKISIPWDQKTAVTTTATFKRIKDFVLTLKEDRAGQQIIVTPAELRELLENQPARVSVRLRAADEDIEKNREPDANAWRLIKFTDAEMMTAVERLASHGYVRLLTTSDGEQRILLVPELLNNLAASFVLEARRNPKGLGAIEEQKVLDDGYRFAELDGLSKSDESLPPLLRGRTYADFRHEDDYFATAFDLMLSLYGLGFTLPGIAAWRAALRGDRRL